MGQRSSANALTLTHRQGPVQEATVQGTCLTTITQQNQTGSQASAAMQMRSALFSDFTQRIMVNSLPTLACLTLQDETDTLYRNVGRKLPFYAA